MFLFTALLLLFATLSTVAGDFTNPPPVRRLFRLGEIETIEYETEFKDFSIALWQQNEAGGSALLGPIVFQTGKGGGTKFDWVVQTYDFNLTDSDIFFFWMFEGNRSNQGSQKKPNMSSPFFKIAPPEQEVEPEPAPRTTSSAIATTTAPGEESEPSTTSDTFSNTAATGSQEPTSIAGSPQSSNDDLSDKDSEVSSGLSNEAKIGLGVGLCIGSLCLGIVTFFLVRYLRAKQRALATPHIESHKERELGIQRKQDWSHSAPTSHYAVELGEMTPKLAPNYGHYRT